MPVFLQSVLLNAPVEAVFAFHEREDALQLLSPAFPPVRVIRRQGGIESGSRVELRIGPFRWVALHSAYRKNRLFEDRQVSGPFAEWIHRHEFEPVGTSTRLTDRIDYRLPGGKLVNRVFAWAVQLGLRGMFRHRHRVTKAFCEKGFNPGSKAVHRAPRNRSFDKTLFALGPRGCYFLGYSYQNNGNNVNITGSPGYNGRVSLLGALGSACSDNQYGQFDATKVRGPGYGSLGLESGRNYPRGCMNRNVDLSLVRRIRVPGGEKYQVEMRADVFNAGNWVVINGRSNSAQFANPTTNTTLVNNQYNADGSLNTARLQPRNAGFGAATGAQALRTIQLQLRLRF